MIHSKINYVLKNFTYYLFLGLDLGPSEGKILKIDTLSQNTLKSIKFDVN